MSTEPELGHSHVHTSPDKVFPWATGQFPIVGYAHYPVKCTSAFMGRGKQLPRSEEKLSLHKEVFTAVRLSCAALWSARAGEKLTLPAYQQTVMYQYAAETVDVDVGQGSASLTQSNEERYHQVTGCCRFPSLFTKKEAITQKGRKSIRWEQKTPPANHLPSVDRLPLYGMVMFLICCENVVMVLPFVDRCLGIPVTEQRALCLGRRLWVWIFDPYHLYKL